MAKVLGLDQLFKSFLEPHYTLSNVGIKLHFWKPANETDSIKAISEDVIVVVLTLLR
jgi:hypothetical protein